MIAAHGIEAITLRRVAAEAGASVGRLQHYYATREELVRDSCRMLIAMAGQTVDHEGGAQPASPAKAATDLRGLLVATIPGQATTRAGIAVWLAYLAKGVDDPEIATLIADAERGTTGYVATLIAALTPDADAETARSLAVELLSLSQGLSFRALSGAVDAEDAVAIIERRLAAEGLALSAP